MEQSIRQGESQDSVQHLVRFMSGRARVTRRLPVLLTIIGLLFMALPAAEPPSARATILTEIAMGVEFTCVLTPAGEVKCWGNDEAGQLGNGDPLAASLVPVDVTGVSGATTMASGRAHSCAATSTGVQCWGWNFVGQLGYGKSASADGPLHERRSAPVDVVGLGGNITALAAGEHHTCALTSAGGVKCWGWNGLGQLGDGTTDDNPTPVDVSGLSSGVVDITAGRFHTCALTSSGGVKCWGSSETGQLGNGTSGTDEKSSTPVDVTGLTSGVVAIDSNTEHSCAVTDGGAVKCWGRGNGGQLGDGVTGYSHLSATPVDVNGLSNIVKVATGSDHTCALTDGGAVKCWGEDGVGQRGDGDAPYFDPIPVDVVGLNSGVQDLDSGPFHVCAIVDNGQVMCWGWNNYGQLGNNDETRQNSPIPVAASALNLTAPPLFTSALPSNAGNVGDNYSHTFVANGFPVPTYSVTGGSLPPGLSLNSTTGVLTGTLTTSGDYPDITVTADNGVAPPATQAFTITVREAPTITSGAPPSGTYGSSYSHTFTASGFPEPTFRVTSGTLPNGLTLGPDGVLSGTPTQTGVYPDIVVTADNGVTDAQTVTITVDKAALTITAEDKSKVYGAALPTLMASYSGFVNGDTAAVLDTPVTLSTSATAGSPVGLYDIVPGGVTDDNYDITFVNGTLSVTPATLTVKADNKIVSVGKPRPELTVTYSGFVNNDDASVLQGNPVLNATNDTSTVGEYPITVVTNTLTADNYVFSFVDGILTVTDKEIPEITWNDPLAIIYGTPLSATQLNASTDVAGTFSYSPTLGTVLNAGNDQVLSVVFTPDDPAKYISVEASVAVDVARAPLTIRADDKTKQVGSANPPLTATYSGLVNDDTAQDLDTPVTLTTPATVDSPVGSYPITASGAADANYTITFEEGILTVTDAAPSAPPVTIYLPLLQQS